MGYKLMYLLSCLAQQCFQILNKTIACVDMLLSTHWKCLVRLCIFFFVGSVNHASVPMLHRYKLLVAFISFSLYFTSISIMHTTFVLQVFLVRHEMKEL